MLLAIDIGNTDVVFGIWTQEKWVQTYRISSRSGTEASIYHDFWKGCEQQNGWTAHSFTEVVMSTVVPDLRAPFESWLTEHFEDARLVMVDKSLFHLLPIKIRDKAEIGTDLVANAVAGWNRFGESTVVVDFGTALTFTILNDEGEVTGVAIAPGLKTAMRALFSNAAQLYEVPLQLPESVLGRSTEHALQAGILHGYIGLVEYLLDKIEDELDQPCRVIATGGLVSILKPLHERFDAIEPHLTLEGLRLISQITLSVIPSHDA